MGKKAVVMGAVVVVLLWPAAAGAAARSRGAVADWPFDEASGKLAEDRAGGDNNGTLHGSPSAARVRGPFGSHSLAFIDVCIGDAEARC